MRRKGIAAAWIVLCFALFIVFRIKWIEPAGILFLASALAYTVAGCLAVCRGESISRLLRGRSGNGTTGNSDGKEVCAKQVRKRDAPVCVRFSDIAWFLGVWGILILFWLPAYLALFPGTFGYDVPEQMQQFFGVMPLTSHHPVLHTWLVGGFIQAGERLFRSGQAGFALFSFLQGMVVTNSLACSFLFLKRRRVPTAVILAGLLGCALHPILQSLSLNATKDTLFGAFFLYFMMAFIAVLEKTDCPGERVEGGRCSKTDRRSIRLVLSGVAMCLFRNQGVYIVLALAVFCLLFRTGRRTAAGCLCVIFLVSEGFFLFCSRGLGIPEGDRKEMLCVPMQQAAIVWQNRENADISPEQRAALEELIEPEALGNYLPKCADPVKAGFRTSALMEDPGKYFGVYLELGLQNPGLYVNALQALTVPYLDGSLYRVPETTLEFTNPHINEWGIERNSLFPAYEAYLEKAVGSPVCVFLLQPGMAVWLMVILAGAAFVRKSSRLFLSILPGALFFGTLLLSSGALLRYIYPLMLAVPLYLGLLFTEGEGVCQK